MSESMHPEDSLTQGQINSRKSDSMAIEIKRLEAENAKLREGLENIVQHQMTIGGHFASHGSVVQIAKRALEREVSDE